MIAVHTPPYVKPNPKADAELAERRRMFQAWNNGGAHAHATRTARNTTPHVAPVAPGPQFTTQPN